MADQAAQTQGQLLAAFRRHAWLLILLGVLAAVVGVGMTVVVPAPATASATVLVSPLEGNPYSPQGRGDDLINLETEAQLLSTDAVAKMAAERARLSGDITTGLSVTVPPNTQILTIAYRARGRAAARNGAQAFADSYLKYRQQRAQSVINGRVQKLKDQYTRVEQALKRTNQELATSAGSQRSFLQRRVTAYTNQLGVIDEQSNDISSTPTDPGQVITPARLPGGSGFIRPVIFGAGGLVVGLLLGAAVVLLRQRLTKRLRDAKAIEGLGIPTLASIPGAPEPDSALALVNAPKSPAGDAYRRLRAAVVAANPQTPLALLITSATPGGVTTLTSANLAVALAFAGSKTILLDATTSATDPTELFGLPPGRGLSDALLHGEDPATLLINADPQLRLLPRGREAQTATHRFSGPRMREAIKVLRRRSEFLVINGPSVHDADAQALCTFVDAILLVVTRNVTTRQELQQAYIEAERSGATVLGAVLETEQAAAFAGHAHGGGYGGHGGGAHAGYQQRPPQRPRQGPPQGRGQGGGQGGEARRPRELPAGRPPGERGRQPGERGRGRPPGERGRPPGERARSRDYAQERARARARESAAERAATPYDEPPQNPGHTQATGQGQQDETAAYWPGRTSGAQPGEHPGEQPPSGDLSGSTAQLDKLQWSRDRTARTSGDAGS